MQDLIEVHGVIDEELGVAAEEDHRGQQKNPQNMQKKSKNVKNISSKHVKNQASFVHNRVRRRVGLLLV